jgi:asparagine synthase (glutamine-hydrolysing)
MCGIAGYFAVQGSPDPTDDAIRRMTATISHRGPDSDGYFTDDRCSLGVRRLAIVDLDGGDQPLYNEDRTVVLACNGEIFNHAEIRADLETKGHRFRTNCDVEVIVHLYEQLGCEAVNLLNGQFAFAIYDIPRRLLFLARDPFGVCPLYFTTARETLVFGSEIKAVVEFPGIPREVDLVGLDQILLFPGLVSPRTIFKGIESLPAGHCLVARDGDIAVREFWDLVFQPDADASEASGEEQCRSRLEELLTASVYRRLMGDVPVGLYLSGGLDSSLLGALMRRVSPETERHSFSVSFTDTLISERGYQQIAARHLRTKHHDTLFDGQEIAGRLRQAIYHCETPLKETYNTCSLALSESARRHGAKVVLCGEGADELFAGYVGYRFDQYGVRGRRRDDLAEALEDEFRARLWGSADIFYEVEYEELDQTRAALYSAGLRARAAEFDCTRFPVVNHQRLRGLHPLHQRSYLDFKLRLCDHLVADHGDRMAMANSVEARYPFLDRPLVEYVAAMSPALKLNRYRDKYLLRRVAEPWLPLEIVAREKWGFHAPGVSCLLQQKNEWVLDLLSHDRICRQGYFKSDTVEMLKIKYSQPGFRLNLPFEQDLLAIVLTFGILIDLFGLPSAN